MRRNVISARKICPDYKYNNVLIRKLINNMMEKGKLVKAENICYYALEKAAEEMKESVLDFFQKVLSNTSPVKNLIPRRYGGTTYSIPKTVAEEKRPLLAIKIITRIAKNSIRKKGQQAKECLYATLLSARNNEGEVAEHLSALKKNIQANEAFSHLL